MIDFTRLEVRIMNDEGFSATPYLDTERIPTIGYGTTSILGRPVTLDASRITPQVARTLLRADIYGALVDAQHVIPRFAAMDAVRQEVLTNMAYNLGRHRLEGFVQLRERAKDLDYQGMAAEMIDSLWYRQVKGRAERLVKAMRSGQW